VHGTRKYLSAIWQRRASARGFEATLWATADKLRGNLDAAEYKHVVLGLIFLKYISDAFEEERAELQKEKALTPKTATPRFAKRTSTVGQHSRGGLGKPNTLDKQRLGEVMT